MQRIWQPEVYIGSVCSHTSNGNRGYAANLATRGFVPRRSNKHYWRMDFKTVINNISSGNEDKIREGLTRVFAGDW